MKEISLDSKIESLELQIREVATSSEELSSRELIDLQMLSDKWSLMVNLESTLAKKSHETLSKVLDRV